MLMRSTCGCVKWHTERSGQQWVILVMPCNSRDHSENSGPMSKEETDQFFWRLGQAVTNLGTGAHWLEQARERC